MDALTSAIVGLKFAETASTIQYAVAAKVLKTSEAQGDVALKLIEAAEQGFSDATQNASDAISTQLDLYA